MSLRTRAFAATVAVLVAFFAFASAAQARISKELKEELMPEIERGLKAKDPLQQAHAILAAGVIDDRKLNKELEPFLENTNRQVRLAAIVALTTVKNRKGKAALEAELDKAGSGRYVLLTELLPQLPERERLAVLKDMVAGRKVDAGEQKDGLRYIAEFGDDKVYDLLGQVVKARKAADREPYARVLLDYPREEALPWAEKLMADKRDVEARRLGLKLAVKIGGPKVDGLARKALADSDPEVTAAGLAYLARAKDPSATDALLKSLQDETDDKAKIEKVERILAIGHKPPVKLAAELLDGAGDNAKVRRAYIKLFGASGAADAVERLQQLEQSTKIEERRDGVIGLAWTKSPVAVQVLSRTIFDGDDEVRRLSIEGFGVVASPSTVNTLNSALTKARDAETQHAIVRALGQIKSDESATALMFKVRDRDPEIKRLALEGLANIRSAKTRSVLDVLVSDTDPSIRFRATTLLLELDKERGMAQLERALKRPPADYVEMVNGLPTPLRDEVLLTMLKNESKQVRSDAWDAIVLLEREGLGLIRLVAAGDYPQDVRSQAIDTLALHTRAKDVDLFKRLAQTGSEEEKLLAMRWLIRRAGPDLSGFFRTLMNGFKAQPSMRSVAVYGLLMSEK